MKTKKLLSHEEKSFDTDIIYLCKFGDELYKTLHIFASGPPAILPENMVILQEYTAKLPELTETLANEVTELRFDYLISPLTSRTGYYSCDAYISSILSKQPDLINLTSALKREETDWITHGISMPIKSGKGNAPIDILLKSISFNPITPDLKKDATVLIVDDCLSSGKTATAIMVQLSAKMDNPTFTIAVPVLL